MGMWSSPAIRRGLLQMGCAIVALLGMSPAFSAAVHDEYLDNGLRVVIKEDHRAPVVVVMVWYRVGSVDEPAGQTGLSHVLEHMMFKGSKEMGPGDFSKWVARFGGTDNAFTSSDYTAYYQQYEASRLPLALELEAERMGHLRLDPQEFEREVQVVLEERRARVEDNPHALAREKFETVLYGGTGYAHPVIGWRHDLNSLTHPQALDWYHRYYRPANATLVIAGDVNLAEARKLVKRYFADLEPGPRPVALPVVEDRPVGERRIWIKAPVQVPVLRIAFNVPSLKSAADPEAYYALTMLAGVLDGGMSARFEKHLVREHALAVSIGAGYSGLGRGDGVFSIVATPAQGVTLAQLEAAIWRELEQIQSTPPSREELETVLAGVLSGRVYEQDSVFNQAYELGILSTLGLDLSFSDQFVEQVSAVTPDAVSEAARHWLTRERMAVAEVRNADSAVPAAGVSP